MVSTLIEKPRQLSTSAPYRADELKSFGVWLESFANTFLIHAHISRFSAWLRWLLIKIKKVLFKAHGEW